MGVEFLIEIRNRLTGEAKGMRSLEEIGRFLADKVESEWEGWRHLGPLAASSPDAPAADAPAVPDSAPAQASEELPAAVVEPEAAVDVAEEAAPAQELAAQDATTSDAPQAAPEPTPEPMAAPESLVEKIEHAVIDAVHAVIPGQ